MPAIRTRPRDVIVRVPKSEPFSNEYAASKGEVGAIPSADAEQPAPTEQAETRKRDANSPTLGFITLERDDKEAVDLAKASTSSAEWNSLLVWARRQRGPQWDSGIGLWQVDKNSKEYYSFCADPTQSVGQEQPEQAPQQQTEPQDPYDLDSPPIRSSRRK